MLEDVYRADKIGHYTGGIDLDMLYQSGRAGQVFFKNLKEKGLLTYSRCGKCGEEFIPPRIYCISCMSDDIEYLTIEPRGRVEIITTSRIDKDGKPLETPETYALIRFGNLKGGLVHRLGELGDSGIAEGDEVVAVLKPEEERKGSINDILYFKPLR